MRAIKRQKQRQRRSDSRSEVQACTEVQLHLKYLEVFGSLWRGSVGIDHWEGKGNNFQY